MKAAVRDEVILSPMAQDLQKIKKEMQDASEVREDKVSEVAGRISRGEYRVDTGKIAAKIVRTGSLDELV